MLSKKKTEFPPDAPMSCRRMHSDKLARKRDLFEAFVDMLEESPQMYQQCRNFRAAEKWHERLLQNHIDYLRKLLIARLVADSTKLAETRWRLLIDWTKPEALTATDVIRRVIGDKKYTRFDAIRHTYISKMTKVLVRQLVRPAIMLF